MKIAVVAAPFYPVPPVKYGGTERVVYYLIKGLKELGHEPILLGPGDSKVDCQIIPIVYKAINFPLGDDSVVKAFRAQARKAELKTSRLLKQLAPSVDIIHSHGFDMKSFKKYPNITTLHTRLTFDDINYYKKRTDLSFIAISKNQRDAMPYLSDVDVVYNGEDPSEFEFVNKPDNYLCFLGRFDRDKNPHLAIELAINLGMKIKVAGKVDFEGGEYFESEIKKYINHPQVEYLGEIGFEQKVKLLSRAKCNLHPISFREPFGLTVIEAAYCGTPTLAIRRGSMKELIQQDKTGLVVEDFIEGRNRIEECFKMNRRNIARITDRKFNYLNMAIGYVKAYRRIIKQKTLRG